MNPLTNTEQAPPHHAVMLDEAIRYINPQSGGIYLDATVGAAGHSKAILERSAPDGVVVCLDRDASAIALAKAGLQQFGTRARFHHTRFSAFADALHAEKIDSLDGAIADFGVSSMQLDRPERGFSFRNQGPLDMRMDQSAGPDLLQWLSSIGERQLADWIWRFGEERRSRRIAKAIKQALTEDKLHNTQDLANVVAQACGGKWRRVHPATKTFQALRIAINEELEEIASFVEHVPAFIKPGGVFVAISFHSLEDRIVKHTIRQHPLLEVLTKKPLVPDEQEIASNPRSRSAKLRAAKRAAIGGEA